jgi:hypothetical protein
VASSGPSQCLLSGNKVSSWPCTSLHFVPLHLTNGRTDSVAAEVTAARSAGRGRLLTADSGADLVTGHQVLLPATSCVTLFAYFELRAVKASDTNELFFT